MVIPLFIGILIAAFALSQLVTGYFRTTRIYVASTDIDPLTALDESMYRAVSVHADFGNPLPGVIRDPADAEGKIAHTFIPAGTPLFASQLADPDEIHHYASELPADGKRYVTLPADAISALGGGVQRGMRLDIWAIYRAGDKADSQITVVAENALVVDTLIDHEMLEGITFALHPEDAARAALAGHVGRLYYALPGETPAFLGSGRTIEMQDLLLGSPYSPEMEFAPSDSVESEANDGVEAEADSGPIDNDDNQESNS